MGRDLNYSNLAKTVIIDTPTIFDGTNYLETDCALMKEDKDWTIFLDIQFTDKTDFEINTLVSCARRSVGFTLDLEKASLSQTIHWFGTPTTANTA